MLRGRRRMGEQAANPCLLQTSTPGVQRSTRTSPLYRDYLPLGTEKRVQLFALQTMSGIHLRSPCKGKSESLLLPGGSRFSQGTPGRLVLQGWQPSCRNLRASLRKSLGAEGHLTGPLRCQRQRPPWSLNPSESPVAKQPPGPLATHLTLQ